MKLIKHTSPTKPKFGAVIGDNALATVKDINQVIMEINAFSDTQNINATGTTQATAAGLIVGINLVTTAPGQTGVILPCLSTCSPCAPCNCCNPDQPSDPVAPVIVKNLGTEDLNVYPCLGVAIDGLAPNAPFVVPMGSSVQFIKIDCSTWASFSGMIGIPGPVCTDNITITGTGLPGDCLTVEPFTVPVCTDATLTGDGTTGNCLSVVSGPSSVGYAEYVQHTQAPNNSIPPGQAIEYLTDSPAGVYNTLGITTATGPAAIGTAFNLPVGVYMIDYENSAAAASSFAIYQGASNTVLAIDTDTISGSSTGTTWVHGRAIITSTVGNTWIMISSVVGTADIPTAGTAAGEYIARLTILKLG